MSAHVVTDRLESPFLSEEIREIEPEAADAYEQDYALTESTEEFSGGESSSEDYSFDAESWPDGQTSHSEADEEETDEAVGEECEEAEPEAGSDGEDFQFDTAKPVDLATAKNVIWEVIRILNRQHDANAADPDRLKNPPDWHSNYKPVLKEWYALVYGEPSAKGRIIPQGDALKGRLDAVLILTQPLLGIVKSKGGKDLTDQLPRLFYTPVAEIEYLAARTAPPATRASKVTFPDFGKRPTPVSLEQFFLVISKQDSQPLVIQRGHNFRIAGEAKPGTVFSASRQDDRVFLWAYNDAVLFMRDGVIYAQDRNAFSDDIVLGAFVIAAQNAAGSAILAQLMVETALSFTPWGVVADGLFALKALTEGDLKGALIQALPGPAISLAGKSQMVRRVAGTTARGAAHVGKMAGQLAKESVRYIGRGVYRVGNKLLRGFWVIGDTAGSTKRTFRFFDEHKKIMLDVPESIGNRRFKCTNPCKLTSGALAETLEGAADEIVEEVMQDLKLAKAYAPSGRVLVSRKLLKDVMQAYGPAGEWVIEWILQTWQSAPKAHKLVNDSLAFAKDLSKIKGAVEIFEDMASSSMHTARGTLFELSYAAKYAKEIEELGIPVARGKWYGKGLDVLKKNGDAVELKYYKLASEFVTRDPRLTIARVARQVKSRLGKGYKDVKRVVVVFSSHTQMTPAFRKQLQQAVDQAAAEAAAEFKIARKPVVIQTWP